MSQERYKNLVNFYRKVTSNTSSTPMLISGDASFRKFYRVPEGIIMDAPPTTEKNHEFVKIANALNAAQILAPKILATDYEQGFLLVSDLGDEVFAKVTNACKDSQARVALYKEAINLVVKFVDIQVDDLPIYDAEFIAREDNICLDYYFQAKNYVLNDKENAIIKHAEDVWTKSNLESPQIVMHRDFHGRNIMSLNGNLGVVDFQDMVKGPLCYDLVSLLRDCYYELPKNELEQLLKYAYEQYSLKLKKMNLSYEQFVYMFDMSGLQRHFKCLGIFNRLNIKDHKPKYLNDIPLVEKYVLEVASKYETLNDFVNLINKVANI